MDWKLLFKSILEVIKIFVVVILVMAVTIFIGYKCPILLLVLFFIGMFSIFVREVYKNMKK